MNKSPVIIYFLSIIFSTLLFSCGDKTVDYGLDQYYVEFVTAQSGSEFLTDQGKLLVATPNDNSSPYAAGDRVLLNYTLLSTSENNYTVRINGSSKIPLGKITLSDESAIQSSAKEPILLESVWLGSHYLNMLFYVNYKSATHKIGLLVDSTRLESDTLRMYFIHDTNNDPPGYPTRAYLSFDLKDILGDPGKSRPVSVQINTSNYGDKTYELEY